MLGSRYRLDALVAVGGLGSVFRAHDLQLDLTVAVKVLTPPEAAADLVGPAQVLDMRREAQAAMTLTHPFILRTYTWDRFGPWELLVMEYVDGETLYERARARPDRRLAAEEAAGFIIDVLTGLHCAHSQGILHNDLKPRNILVAPGDQVKICDFGIASRQGRLVETPNSGLIGTLAFMSPERFRNQPHDARSDVYSVGAMLYALVVGKAPFGTGGLGTVYSHLNHAVPPTPHLTGPLWDIVHRAMSKDPDERYASADAMRASLLRAGFRSAFGGGEVRRVRRPARGGVSRARPLEGRAQRDGTPAPGLDGPALLAEERASPPGMVHIPARVVVVEGRSAKVPGFFLDVHPVTNGDWAEMVRAREALAPGWWNGREPPADRVDHPVTGVTWEAARRYASWQGKRLPTAWEWLSAARATEGALFPWGNACSAATCNCPRAGSKATEPVASHPAGRTPDGVDDLYGNVWEWTAPGEGLTPAQAGAVFAFGASYRHDCSAPGGAVPRAEVAPASEYPYLGFRCAADEGGTP